MQLPFKFTNLFVTADLPLKGEGAEKGYVLGPPGQAVPVRRLTSSSCTIMRVIMHAVLLWVSCNKMVVLIMMLCVTHTLLSIFA